MSREIKFRAWDKSSKKWITGSKEGFNLFGECTLIGGVLANKHYTENCFERLFADVIVEQYTGLKDCGLWPNSEFDKDGNAIDLKELYEHDIVEVVSNNIVADGYAYKYAGQRPNGERFVISATEAGFTLIRAEWFDLTKEPYSPSRMGFVNNYAFWNGHRSLKLIGNIHQNPELLKE